MARHRNVRTMNYDEGELRICGNYGNRMELNEFTVELITFWLEILDYEGYDDVYGHSMEDDYCVSPSGNDLSQTLYTFVHFIFIGNPVLFLLQSQAIFLIVVRRMSCHHFSPVVRILQRNLKTIVLEFELWKRLGSSWMRFRFRTQ